MINVCDCGQGGRILLGDGNSSAASRGFDDLDVDVSDIMRGTMSIAEGGARIYKELLAVANGHYTYTALYDTGQSTIGVAGASF